MWQRMATLCVALLCGLWLNNTSHFISVPDTAGPRILAHRGVHQLYDGPPPSNETCTANPIQTPNHALIENTIPSMRAAFDLGADVVELDVHLTPDNVFAVFHDWTLECRTDGTGQTNKTPYSVLATLDAGHGYSVDGATFPLRGKGVGAIPSLRQVFDTFPDKRFLLNFKSNRASEGKALAALLRERPYDARALFGVYGGARPVDAFTSAWPGIPGFDKARIRRCVLRYVGLGWSGFVPQSCRGTLVLLPISHAKWLWGWPHRFEHRLARHGSTLLLAGPYHRTHVRGIDSPALLAQVPRGFRGLVWSNDMPGLLARSP